ncbi:hypothetical protein Tco_0687251 [Tanacetum coccineum]
MRDSWGDKLITRLSWQHREWCGAVGSILDVMDWVMLVGVIVFLRWGRDVVLASVESCIDTSDVLLRIGFFLQMVYILLATLDVWIVVWLGDVIDEDDCDDDD